MDASKRSDDECEMIDGEEFMLRLNIKKSALSALKAKGILLPERHYIKIGKKVYYFWSMERLIEMHRLSDQKQKKTPVPVAQVPVPKSVDRVNWDY